MHEDKNLVPYYTDKIIGAVYTPQGRKNYDEIDWGHGKKIQPKPEKPSAKPGNKRIGEKP